MNLIVLSIIILIESSGNPLAVSPAGCRGLCQVSQVCLQDYNEYHKGEEYTFDEMFEGEKNKAVASWYLNERIPQMIRHYKKEVTVENCLIAYNAGIKYVAEGRRLPRETEDYIKKYKRLVSQDKR